jgi:hypothetical protein
VKRFWAAALLGSWLSPGWVLAEERPMSPTIQEVKARHAKDLLRLPGVVSVGIGRGPRQEPVIIVSLDRVRADTAANMPKTLDGYPVRVEVVGPIKAQ